MVDICYDLASLCGPLDMRVVRFIEEYRGRQFDPSYLKHIERWHGGIPGKQYFNAQDGTSFRVGRFLTMVDNKSELEPPVRLSWEFRERDIRIDWSVLTLIDEEGPSCRHLFSGERLLPFASLYWGDQHPDDIGIGEGVVDLLAFDYAAEHGTNVVVCLADKAQEEYTRWDSALVASGLMQDERVRYEDFTVSVAANFDTFLKLLRVQP